MLMPNRNDTFSNESLQKQQQIPPICRSSGYQSPEFREKVKNRIRFSRELLLIGSSDRLKEF